MNLAGTAAKFLGHDGALACNIPGFAPRPGQIELAREVARAIESGTTLVAEAGTGIGKTFAYLVPILLAGRRALVSTSTRALQDQLYERDLPLVAKALGRPLRIAVLKGRRNYLCRERYLRFAADRIGPGLDDELDVLAAWVRSTRSGDFAELPGHGEQSRLRRLLSVGVEGCMAAECPEFPRCHVFAARRAALVADVVIVNHHLLIADFAMKSEGSGDLLGATDVVVVDEAHALAEVARQGLGVRLSSSELAEITGDADRVLGDGAVRTLAGAVETAVASVNPGRYGWPEGGRLDSLISVLEATLGELEEALADSLEAESLAMRVASCLERLAALSPSAADSESFRWYEVNSRAQFTLHRTPLAPGAILGAWIGATGASWVFTSATLAVADRFDGVLHDLGLEAARTVVVESPFNYAEQARLYLPPNLPDVDDPDYTGAVVHAAEPLVEAAGGGCFLLFTSRRAMAEAALLVRERGWAYPLFVQDEEPRAQLLAGFRAAGNGVLVGTSSFWQGVDVKGDALVLVVIDRLPFDSPADPLLRARLDYCRAMGGNPFADIQLTEAAMALKQGAGRLIRDRADHGVLMLCDPRLRSRSYGARFLSSLPPMPVVTELCDALDFLVKSRGRAVACA